MERSSSLSPRHCFACITLLLIPFAQNFAQEFQQIYGTNLDNTFSKVIPDGSDYYVLGQDEPLNGALPNATVTRLDANGIHQWTLRLDIPSAWNDAVLTPSGDLLVVGNTLPFDATNQSLIGLVTPAGGGNFTWVRTYDVTGREGNYRIIRSPVPENASFPYYIAGGQFDPNGGPIWDDITLMNIDESGTFNWKKRFPSVEDDEFARNLDVLSNGDLILAGSLGTQGVILLLDHSGTLISGVTPDAFPFTYADVSPIAGGGFYAVGTTFPPSNFYLLKYDNDLSTLWDSRIIGLTAISQVWTNPANGDIYVTGSGSFNGVTRGVLVYLVEIANSPVIQWIKFLDNGETSYTGGNTTFLSPNQIAFVDGRTPSAGGFGTEDAFISVSDPDFETCITDEEIGFIDILSLTYNAPVVPDIEFFDFSTGIDVLSAALNWQQENVCSEPCQADFIVTPIGDCGHYQVTNTSTGEQPLTYQWCNGAATENLDVILPCGPHTFCLTITDAVGCTSTAEQTITVTDSIPPVVVCVPPFGVTLDSNCEAILTPAMVNGGSSDNCQIQSLSVSPGILTGCGVFPVTLTVTDWCGNTGTCMTFIQTIEDIPPVIICPSNVVVTATTASPCSMVVNGLSWLSATDNCGTPFVDYIVTGATSNFGQNDASGLTYNEGVSTVTYTATDDCGNIATCSFTVTVNCTTVDDQKCGWTVATCYAANPGDPVGVIYDTRYNSLAIPGEDWGNAAPPVPTIHPLSWKRDSIGNVFGIALGSNDKIFLAASDIYRYDNPALSPAYGPGGSAGVYMTDCNPPYATSAIVGTLNLPTLFPVTGTLLPNTANAGGNGIGNIAYDNVHNQLFLTNLEDGRIYRITPGGIVLSAYDPFQLDNGQPGLAGILGERIWGIGIYNNRVYFARENLLTNKQVWSIPIDAVTGEFVATTTGGNLYTGAAQLEINNGPGTQKKYTDIAFSNAGLMLVAERGSPHDAGIYEFKNSAGWVPSGNTFFVGNNVSGKNSSGGVDYGYREHNGNPKANCDDLIWASGNCMDPSAIPNNWCQVYGLEAISASGNTYPANSATDIYIDFDGIYNANPKYQIGDVEVFKCGCPGQPAVCDSISITSMAFNGPQDTCCFKLTVNNQLPDYWTGIQLCASNGVSISNISLLNNWCLQSFSASQVTLVPPGCTPNEIPLGSQDFINFCLSNYDTVPNQQIVVKYFGPDFEVVCEDTLNYQCTQKPKCLEVTSTVECAPNGQYLIDFCIMSNAFIGFNVNSIQLNPPPNVTFTPSAFLINNLLPGQMQCNISTLVSGAVVDGQSICFSVTAHNGNILSVPPLTDPSPSCTDTVMLACVTMPSCVCDKVSVDTMSVSSPGDECCWEVILTNNYSNNFFTGIQLDIVTPGVVFGAINNPGFLWNLTSNSTQATFIKLPPGTFIGLSETLPTFCLSGITSPAQVPQIVVLKWLDANGREVCVDTLKFNCPPPVISDCAVLVSPHIECDPTIPGIYNFSFQIQNNSGFTINQVVLNNVTPPAIFPFQFNLTPALLNGQTSTQVVSAQISGVQQGQQVCFYLSVNDIGPNGNELNRCTHSQKYCFTMPACNDSCCTDSIVFSSLVNQGFTVVNDSCMVTVTAPQFDSCYVFGTPPYVVGGAPPIQVITDPGGSWTFTFTNSGTYQICVTVFDGCQGKEMCTNVVVNCANNCQCGTFSDMAFRFERGPGVPVSCGAGPVTLPCPPAGYNYTLTGKFECQGTGCPSDAPLTAQLEQPDGTVIAMGNQLANPYFGISLSNLDLKQFGVYTLTLTGQCGTQICTCVIRFIMDPPCSDVCPCEPADIQAFITAAQAASQVHSPLSCKVCFTPNTFGECENVNWTLDSIAGTLIGSTVGNQSFCYTFPGPGTYTMYMAVSRIKDDGTHCVSILIPQTVVVTCGIVDECLSSVFDNPTFSEGAVAGGLLSGGMSRGWNAVAGEPEVIKDADGSFDGWSMLLYGNLDTAAILSRMEPVCLTEIEGMVTVRIAVNDSAPGGIFAGKAIQERPCDIVKIELFQGDQFELNRCNGIDCYSLGKVSMQDFEKGIWNEFQIPYNLNGWVSLDSCGEFPGVLVRPVIYVTNALSNNQGGEDTYSFVEVDNFCFNGMIVAVDDPQQKQSMRIYPNPNTGLFTIELSEPARQSMSIRIMGLTGQILFEQKTRIGNSTQLIEANDLPQGMYFLQLLSDNRLLSVNKFVKQ